LTKFFDPICSRAQSKIEGLGFEALLPETIRQTVHQSQPKDSETGGIELPLLPLDAFQLQPNGEWLLQDHQVFQLDLVQFIELHQDCHNLVVRRCRHFQIVNSGGELVIPDGWDCKWLLLIDQCQHFQVKDLRLRGSRNPIGLNLCSFFRLERLIIKGAQGYGLTLLHCYSGTVCHSSFLSCLASGINIVGLSHDLYVQHCRIIGSIGPYNWDAGINCMHCSPGLTIQQVPEASHEALDLREKLSTPHRIWIESCVISHCRAQGVYLEGAAQVLIEDCLIQDNNKEGICFDWGTALCYLLHSQLVRNGERADYDDATCAIDFLPGQFRDSKGRHWCQLPGISIDNGYANTIEQNLIAANFGGGIKIVRSGFNNLIRFNSLGGNRNNLCLDDDHESQTNPYQPSEIKILNMGPGDQEEFENERAYLDFLPSQGNCIYGNLISGGRHGRNAILGSWDADQVLRTNQINL